MSVLEVIPSVYQIRFRYANVLLIVGEELTLVDTGFHGSLGTVIKAINHLGRSVSEISLIIITHNHWDHVGGLPELRKVTGARVAAHRADFNPEHLSYPKLILKLVHMPLLSHYRNFFYAERGEIDFPLKDGEVFDVLGGLEVIHTPGHTPGSISLYSPSRRILMVADTLAKHRQRIDPPRKRVCDNLSLAMESVRKLAVLDFDTICFGHGRPLYGDIRAKVQAVIKSPLR